MSDSAAQPQEMSAELKPELELHGQLIAAQRALHEIAENRTRTSHQHRARALLALEELENRYAE